MGQPAIKKIEECLLQLQEESILKQNQLKQFMAEYVRTGKTIHEVNKFMDNPSTELFLKYFINNSYKMPAERRKIIRLTLKESQGRQYIIQDHELQLKSKCKSGLQSIKAVFLTNCSLHKMKQIVNDFILSMLNINSYFFYSINQNHQVKSKNSILANTTKIQKKDPLYSKIISKGQNEYSLHDNCLEISCRRNNCIDCFQFELDETYEVKFLNKISLWRYFQKVCRQISMIFEQFQKKENQGGIIELPVNKFCEFVLNLIDLSLKIQIMKLNKQIQLNTNIEFNILNKERKDQTMESFIKVYIEICNKIKIYKKQINKKDQIYLDFNRFGSLEFIYGEYSHPVMNYIKNKIGTEEPKISKIFSKHKKMINYLRKINNGLIEEKSFLVDPSVKLKFSTNQRGTLSSLSVNLLLEEEEQLQRVLKIKPHKQSGSSNSINSSFVHKICQENPNFAKSGWFRIFLDNEDANRESSNNQPKELRPLSDLQMNLAKKKGFSLEKFENYIEISKFRAFLDLENEEINLLEYSTKQLETFVIKVFSRLDFFRNLPHENDEFPFFLRDVHEAYESKKNPFHNFTHGVNVMHIAFLLSLSQKNKSLLSSLELFTIVFSGLCHDIGHTGFTNLFQIASDSHLSSLYNGNSPLENFHASKSFELLRKPKNNFLSSLCRKKFSQFRQQFIANILHTDIKYHFHLISQFEEGQANIKENNNLLTNTIVHASDFASCVKNFEICKTWSQMLSEEFSNQYMEEGKLGLKQTPFMKDLKNPLTKSKNEAGFLRVIVHPLYKMMSTFYPNDFRIQKMLANLNENLEEWERIQSEEEMREKHPNIDSL